MTMRASVFDNANTGICSASPVPKQNMGLCAGHARNAAFFLQPRTEYKIFMAQKNGKPSPMSLCMLSSIAVIWGDRSGAEW